MERMGHKMSKMYEVVSNFIQLSLLDNFYYVRSWTINVILWLAFRVAAYEIKFNDVKVKTKHNNRLQINLNLDAASDLDLLLKTAESLVKDANARRVIVTDKCKTLFTFNSALLALIAVFQNKTLEFSSFEVYLYYFALFMLVVAIIVLWQYFDVGSEAVISLEQDMIHLDKANLQKSLINSNLNCCTSIDNRTDYLVDIYKTSRFYLMIGFVIMIIVCSHNFYSRVSKAQNIAVANEKQ